MLIRDELTGDELWLDVTGRHDTTKDLSAKSLAHHREIFLADSFSLRSAGVDMPMSPALVIAEQEKHDTYQPLVNYAQLLVAKRKRRKSPSFM